MNKRYALALAAALAVLVASQAVGATTWQSLAGAQSFDEAIQVEAFLPNELWVHVGDSITWTFPAGEIHTVTFLKPGQVRPSNGAGCPGTTPDQSNFDGSACVTLRLAARRAYVYGQISNRRQLQSRLLGACQHDRSRSRPRTIRGASLSADLL